MSPTALFIPLSFVMGLVLFGLAVRWYWWPWANRVTLRQAATPILLLHSSRYIGLGFLVPGLVNPLLSPVFTHEAAWGDLATACLALIALAALCFEVPGRRALLWLFSVVGFADLVLAMGLGAAHATPELLQTMYFIPTVAVPLLMVTHVALAGLLLRRDAEAVR
jgi:hypothetical protein